MTSFGKTHPDVERLQELSNAPITEHNAEEFMIFLEKAFINNSWEQYPEPKKIVDSYLSKLGNINESWADEIHTAIRNSNNARGVLASSIRPKAHPAGLGTTPASLEINTNLAHEAEHLIESHTDTRITGKNLEGFKDSEGNEITPVRAVALGLEVIGRPLTHQKIKNWQSAHNIESDGKIGKETYCEMYAEKVLEQAQYKIDEYGISPKTQENILWALKNGNPKGDNIMKLLSFVAKFREDCKDDIKYKSFFEKLDSFMDNSSSNPYVKNIEEEANKPNKAGGSILGDIPKLIEKEMTMSEYVERNGTAGIMIGILLYIFAGNKIPGIEGLPGGGSWFGRVIHAGLFFGLGGGQLLSYGAKKLKDGIGYFSTPEAKAQMQQTREGAHKIAQKTWGNISQGAKEFDTSGFDRKFSELVSSFETRRNTLKNDEGEPLIADETFLGLTGVLNDNTFFNLSIEDLKKIRTKDALYAVLGADAQSKLNQLGPTDTDVENFVQKYLVPELEGQDFVGGYFFDVVGEGLELSGKKYISGNEVLNSEIRREIINLTRTGSEAQKRAGEDFKKAILLGNLESFSLANHPSLTESEKAEIQRVIDEIQYIFSLEGTNGFIAEQVGKIQDITLIAQNGNNGETKTSLEGYLENLEEFKTEGDSRKTSETPRAVAHGIDIDVFSWNKIETAYQTKRLEILEYAKKTLPISELGDININEELGKVEAEKQALDLKEEVQLLSENIEKDFPSENDTPLKLRSWYDENSPHFERVEEIKVEGGLSDEMKTEVEKILVRRVDFIEVYKKVRNTKIEEIQNLEKSLQDTVVPDEIGLAQYRVFQEQFEKASQEYFPIMNTIIAGMLSIEGFSRLFGKDYENENSISYLDRILDEVEPVKDFSFNGFVVALQEKNTDLEKAYSVQNNIENLDVTNGVSVKDVLDEMRRNSQIVKEFHNGNIKERKEDEIQKQARKIEAKYLEAVATTTSISELESLQSSYNEIYSPNEWRDFLDIIPFGKDSIDLTFDKRREELQTGELEVRRQEYFESITGSKADFMEEDLVVKIKDKNAVKEILNDDSLFPMALASLLQYFKIWLLNDELSDYHSDIQDRINYYNQLADNNM